MLLTAVLNLIFSIVLGKLIGLAGIVFASALSRLVTYFWIEPRLLFGKYFGRSCLVYFKGVAKSFVVTIAITMIEHFTASKIGANNWMDLIIKGVAVGGICTAIVLSVYWNTEGVRVLRKKVKTRLSMR